MLQKKSTFLLNQPVFQSETVKVLFHYARFQDTHKTIKLTRFVPFMESSGIASVASQIGQRRDVYERFKRLLNHFSPEGIG